MLIAAITVDLESLGKDIIVVTVWCIVSTILNRIHFSIMAALICIYKNVGMKNQLDFISDHIK